MGLEIISLLKKILMEDLYLKEITRDTLALKLITVMVLNNLMYQLLLKQREEEVIRELLIVIV